MNIRRNTRASGRAAAWAALLIAAVCAAGASGEPAARPVVTPATPRFGDPFTLSVALEVPAGARLELPGAGAFLPCRLVSTAVRETGPGRVRAEVSLQCLIPGPVRLPAWDLSWTAPDGRTGRVRVEAVEVAVASRLPAGESGPPEKLMRDVYGPMRTARPRPGTAFWTVAGAYLAANLLIAGRVLRRRRAGPVSPPPRSGGVRDFAAWSARLLAESDGADDGAFYAELSTELRAALARATGRPIDCMTPRAVAALAVGRDEWSALAALLLRFDVVRFGRVPGRRQADVDEAVRLWTMVCAGASRSRP